MDRIFRHYDCTGIYVPSVTLNRSPIHFSHSFICTLMSYCIGTFSSEWGGGTSSDNEVSTHRKVYTFKAFRDLL